ASATPRTFAPPIAIFSIPPTAGSFPGRGWRALSEPGPTPQTRQRTGQRSNAMDTARFTPPLPAAATRIPCRLSPRLFFHRLPQARENLVGELLDSLQRQPRHIAPKFFYDSAGARLFDHITRLPEYYPTRLERQIFIRYKVEMAAEVGTGRV